MTIKNPQTELLSRIRGGSDVWDDAGAAGVVLRSEWFATGPTGLITKLRAWDGTTWVPGVLKRWSGSAWVFANLKRWTGSSWEAN